MADKAHSAGNPACKSSVPIIKRRDSNRDATILNAFTRWQALHAERQALPETGNFAPDCNLLTIEERAVWKAIDQAENEVHDLPAATPAGVARKLWIAIPHLTPDAESEAAAFRADLDWFVGQGEALDWDLRRIVSALVALKSMEA
jgi:hypothetical protein